MTTSEPTTGEIVRALRYCADANSICGDTCPAHMDDAGCRTVLMQNAADRLESQEREIAELTARAESAEAREAAAKRDLKAYPNCFTCKHLEKTEEESPCSECWGMGIDMAYEWRGLQPHDGGRK